MSYKIGENIRIEHPLKTEIYKEIYPETYRHIKEHILQLPEEQSLRNP